QEDRLRNEVGEERTAARAEVLLVDPLRNEHEHAGPRVVADLGVAERARLLRANPRLADEVAPEGRADHVRLVHQMHVEVVPGAQEIHEGECAEVLASFVHWHETSLAGLFCSDKGSGRSWGGRFSLSDGGYCRGSSPRQLIQRISLRVICSASAKVAAT